MNVLSFEAAKRFARSFRPSPTSEAYRVKIFRFELGRSVRGIPPRSSHEVEPRKAGPGQATSVSGRGVGGGHMPGLIGNDRDARRPDADRPAPNARGPCGPVDRPRLVAARIAARMCGVDPRIIGHWVETGAWPLPHSVHAATLFFRSSDVERWITTGTWPADAPFRSGPRRSPVPAEAPHSHGSPR
jgi:hypothetical protein